MRRILILSFLLPLAFAPIGISASTDSPMLKDETLTGGQVWQITKTFRAGERACVSVVGEISGSVANLEVSVFDSKNVLVAVDKSAGAIPGDFVSVIWYPPREGEYRIEVRNPAAFVKSCYIAVR